MSARVVTTPTGAVELYEAGTGPRVLYLHGDIGNPFEHPFLDELARWCTVIAPCLPGFNGSDDLERDELHDQVVALGVLCDQLDVVGGPAIASSVGAMLALELAAVRAEAFSRLVLIAPAGLWDASIPAADLWAKPAAAQPALLLTQPARAARFFEGGGSPGDEIEEALRRYRTRRRAASLVWPLPDRGLAGRLYSVSVPVHLIWGAADQITPVAYAERFRELLPNVVSLDIIDKAGHLAEWDAPDEVARQAALRLGHIPIPDPLPSS